MNEIKLTVQHHSQSWNQEQTNSWTYEFIPSDQELADFQYEVSTKGLTIEEISHLAKGGRVTVYCDTFGEFAGQEFRELR